MRRATGGNGCGSVTGSRANHAESIAFGPVLYSRGRGLRMRGGSPLSLGNLHSQAPCGRLWTPAPHVWARVKGCRVPDPVRLYRWDEIALEKVTEMVSRKFITGHREMLAQVYLKRGAIVPMHSHDSEQLSYVLQGALKFLVGGESITVREGEVLHIPSWVEHQAEALEDTFELDMFSPIRQDWLDKTDDYFRR